LIPLPFPWFTHSELFIPWFYAFISQDLAILQKDINLSCFLSGGSTQNLFPSTPQKYSKSGLTLAFNFSTAQASLPNSTAELEILLNL
jgi:hypothetical protein